MARSIVEQLSLAAAVVVAAPIALAGLDMTLRGETTWGVALLGVSVLILLVEKHVTTPGSVPGLAAAKVASAVAKDPGEDAEDGEPDT